MAAAAVGGSTLVLAGCGNQGANEDRASALPPSTTEITRTDLVESKTVDGHWDFASRRAVKAAVDGTVTTAATVGKTVERGQALYSLNARPVVLLYGTTPVFRDMKLGDKGPDVRQLHQNLRALGYGRGLKATQEFDGATEAAVKSWQKDLGIIDPSGLVGQGDVVFQPEAVRVVSADAPLAERVGPDKPVLTVASPQPIILADLDQSDQDLARTGTKVEVTLPEGTTVHGEVSKTIQPDTTSDPSSGGTSGSSTQSGLKVEITLAEPVQNPGAQGTASVRFIQESRQGVLTVPVEAIVALREGGYGLQVVTGNQVRVVRVEPGMTADGRIEVTGPGLAEGMKVGVATT
ncbi:peptidoglycan-binding protein [Saccharopolyspora sp. 5N102]|uniref:peptidoglycan-binding protein n=1 Tax=Saccharopolyspora sp. 5N102 TaxID=3375155 RepID=UPI00378A653E